MSKREPILNVPGIVTATVLALVFVHVARTLLLTGDLEERLFLLEFAFIPERYTSSLAFPGGAAADVWTFFTYALIHGDATHLVVNLMWLLPFGSAVARRFGALRYLLFFAVTAAAGAVMHLVTHAGELAPMIGASASISGFMAASIRFVFQAGGPLAVFRREVDADVYRVPAVPLAAVWHDPRSLAFLGVWFALNIFLGLGSAAVVGGEQAIAWQAHIGGFLAGLVFFAAFDPVPRAPRDGNP